MWEGVTVILNKEARDETRWRFKTGWGKGLQEQIRVWDGARQKLQAWIRWKVILDGKHPFDSNSCLLAGENCHGSGVLCSHTKKCCIYCEDISRCDYFPCGCTRARDAVYNILLLTPKEFESLSEPWR